MKSAVTVAAAERPEHCKWKRDDREAMSAYGDRLRWTMRVASARTGLGSGVIFVNNNDLADAIAATSGTTKADARKLVDGVLTAIAEAAAKGQEISLNGFGKFKIKDSPAREGRNPSTGATIQIAASKKLTFTPAKAVKDQLNG
ncbi:hypothetical protein LTR94_028072 [Friedmanniomyces endolithicus]|nr:hypothetical protein LTR94_028072 [Friedmanniomyces endolithicus]